MTLKGIFATALIAFGLPSAALAQDANAALCHHAGLTYSPGSFIRTGQAMQRCALSEGLLVWEVVDEEADVSASANCVSGGREFGHGTILTVGAKELKCSKGIWYPG